MTNSGRNNFEEMSSVFSTRRGIWITWERHRRTRELSRVFGTSLHELLFSGPYPLRILVLFFRTLWVLLKTRPQFLVVQNPSVVLASCVCFLRPFFGYYLIVDRHSNFKLDKIGSREIRFRVFHWLSRYSIRRADLTIVTNHKLVSLLEEWGGRGFVMPDRFPELSFARKKSLGVGQHVMYVCSFDSDEPVSQVIEAARLLIDEVNFYVTGNYRKGAKELVCGIPDNLHFTDFLLEEEYQSLLVSVDVVLTLTTMPHTMQCGAYEAVSAFRPLVFGPDEAMLNYFDKGRVVTNLDANSIAEAIRHALADGERLEAESRILHRERGAWWDNNLKEFMALVTDKAE